MSTIPPKFHRPKDRFERGPIYSALRRPNRELGLAHCLLQVAVELVEELVGRQPRMVGADENGKIAGHIARLDRLDADLLQRLGEFHYIGRVVEGAAILEASGPGEDRGDRVGRGLLPLLM